MKRLVSWLVALCLMFSVLFGAGCQIVHLHIGDTESLVEATGSLNPSIELPLPGLPRVTPPGE